MSTQSRDTAGAGEFGVLGRTGDHWSIMIVSTSGIIQPPELRINGRQSFEAPKIPNYSY